MQETATLPHEHDATTEEPPSTWGQVPTAAAVPNPSQTLRDMALLPTWEDWHWQMRHRLRTLADLKKVFPAADVAADLGKAAATFPMAVTPYYASLIRDADVRDPVFRMSVPDAAELWESPFLADDPLEEEHDMPVPGLVHRYGDRALLVSTSRCAMYCRHCTRKRVAGVKESCLSGAQLERAVAYLREHPEVHDVIVSGGDPFTMPTATLERILAAIRGVPTVDIIRIGTRTPVTMPMRITAELTDMIRKYHPVWVNTHFNHPSEITPRAAQACAQLVDAGIPMGNQTVLLRGINDNPQTMEQLCRGLVRMRVRPYYLFQCDLVRGVEHFRTPLSRGIEIMEYLRGRLSGLAIPVFVVDAPGGGGKIPVLPNYVVSTSPTHTVLRNYEGVLVSYPEPFAPDRAATGPRGEPAAPTVWDLSTGKTQTIRPERLQRHERRERMKAAQGQASAKGSAMLAAMSSPPPELP
jgi:lysine 2,3-aminomutase